MSNNIEGSPEVPIRLTKCGITLDISKQKVTEEEWSQWLHTIAEERDLLKAHAAMMEGALINRSENRRALHTLLRAGKSSLPCFPEVKAERERAFRFAEEIRTGMRLGCRQNRITDIINIGIGGSETGVQTVWHALKPLHPDIRLHFLSSVDGILLERVLAECDPHSTLIVVSSKSFTTLETQVNAVAVDQWLLDAGISGSDRAKHLVVVSAKADAAKQMCLPEENQFKLWDWVGGRFSVWGCIGLPLMIALGAQTFREFLYGAEEMDQVSLTEDLSQNAPAVLALVAYRNSVKRRIRSQCVLPYDERLRRFVPWVQQLEMESLGKPSPDGMPTGQAVWGSNGNEGQHSFYQWLREGTGNTSIDLIWSEMPGHKQAGHYRVLLSNAKAQAEALVMRSKDAPFYNLLTTVALDAVTPRRLGALMALYEHKTTMLGTLYGVNPFDQPGVEMGKRLCKEQLVDK